MRLIRIKENKLFKRWSKVRRIFVPDGVVDEDAFVRSELKVMLIMKEANKFVRDLRSFIKDGGRPQTWDNVARWMKGLNNLKEDYKWSEIKEINEEERKQLLARLCVMNLKKSPGGHTNIVKDLWRVAEEDKDFIMEQISIYSSPNLIICCGRDVGRILRHLRIYYNFDWSYTKRGIEYYEFEKGKFLVNYMHPEAHIADNLIYYGLIDALKEILKR